MNRNLLLLAILFLFAQPTCSLAAVATAWTQLDARYAGGNWNGLYHPGYPITDSSTGQNGAVSVSQATSSVWGDQNHFSISYASTSARGSVGVENGHLVGRNYSAANGINANAQGNSGWKWEDTATLTATGAKPVPTGLLLTFTSSGKMEFGGPWGRTQLGIQYYGDGAGSIGSWQIQGTRSDVAPSLNEVWMRPEVTYTNWQAIPLTDSFGWRWSVDLPVGLTLSGNNDQRSGNWWVSEWASANGSLVVNDASASTYLKSVQMWDGTRYIDIPSDYQLSFGSGLTPGVPETNAVPEPASIAIWSLLGAAACAVAWRRRKAA